MKKLIASILIAGSMTSAHTSAATITYYNNFSDWQANVGTYATEDFEDSTLNQGLSISSASGQFEISSGEMHDRLAPGQAATTFSFDKNINAFGGFWDLAGPGGTGTGLSVTLSTGQMLTQELSRTLNNEFWGFIVSESFANFQLFSGTQNGIAETYDLNEAYYNSELSPVPIPAAAWLFGTALAGLGLFRRKLSK